jgi:sensor histidine kinase YesM
MSKVTQLVMVIVTVQLGAIVLFYAKLGAVEERLASPSATQATETERIDLGSPQVPVRVVGTLPSEERLRQIIREELKDQLSDLLAGGRSIEADDTPSSISEAELGLQQRRASEQLQYYASDGRISELEMEQLEMEIANLDAAGRTHMLRQLTRALNSGQLEGRL